MITSTNKSDIEALAKICSKLESFVRFVLKAEPTSQQLSAIRAIDEGAKMIAIKSGHGTGKSCFVSWVAAWTLYCKIDAKIPVTSPSHPQIKATLFPELKAWCSKVPINAVFGRSEAQTELIKHDNGNFIAVRTARKDNPEALQGFHATNLTYLVDEASGVSSEIFEVIEGALTGSENMLILIGNPTRTDGYFFNAFHKNKELFRCFTFNAEESPRVSKETITRAKKLYGEDSNAYKVRIKGEFPSTSCDGVFVISSIDDAMSRKIPDGDFEKWGVDIAGMGDDSTIICKRSGYKVRAFAKVDGKEQTDVAMAIKQAYINARVKPVKIYVDNIGIGEGVYSILVTDKMFPSGCIIRADGRREAVDSLSYFNKRTEMYYNLKNRLSQCELPNDDELYGELGAIIYEYDNKGRFKLVEKREIKKRLGRSPDKADALALTFYDEFDDELFNVDDIVWVESDRYKKSDYYKSSNLNDDIAW